MDFNLRAISLAESVDFDSQVEVIAMLGKTLEFRSGISIPIVLPHDSAAFSPLGAPSSFMASVVQWARVYRYPSGSGSTLEILGTVELANATLGYRRVRMLQPPPVTRGSPRSPICFIDAQEMNYTQCASWLIDLAEQWGLDSEAPKRRQVLARPRVPKPRQLRFAWIGPEVVGSSAMKNRLLAIGRVFGVDIVHILPHAFSQVKARLKDQMPLAAAVVCRKYAPHISDAVFPEGLDQQMVHFCDSVDREGLEQQIRNWIEVTVEFIETNRKEYRSDEKHGLLVLMLRGMMSHSKIGQFNHCDRTTVLTGIRSRKLSTAEAETILDQHCDQHQDTKPSDKLFLWKDHNDGRRYFLNPKRIDYIKSLLTSE